MKISIYIVDAFASKRFTGNPAAVCPLDNWLNDSILQNIAAENNLAETAFFIKTDNGFHIRWFTPKAEVDLCGHATLATAYTLFELLNYKQDVISFQSRSGILTVKKQNDWLTLNFPVDKIEKTGTDPFHLCFDKEPIEAYQGLADFMLVFSDQQSIETMKPNLEQIAKFEKRGIIITAKGNDTDFVSRYFAPAYGINEDPVTGSAHTTLTPYWSNKLGKIILTAKQLSQRGGFLKCSLLNDRVEISGQAALYLKGEIEI